MLFYSNILLFLFTTSTSRIRKWKTPKPKANYRNTETLLNSVWPHTHMLLSAHSVTHAWSAVLPSLTVSLHHHKTIQSWSLLSTHTTLSWSWIASVPMSMPLRCLRHICHCSTVLSCRHRPISFNNCISYLCLHISQKPHIYWNRNNDVWPFWYNVHIKKGKACQTDENNMYL